MSWEFEARMLQREGISASLSADLIRVVDKVRRDTLGIGYVKGILLGWALCLGFLVTGASAVADPTDKSGDRPPDRVKQDTLRWAAPSRFNVGSAVAGGGHHEQMPYPDPFPNDQEYRKLLAAEFNSVTPENQLKWEFVHPEQTRT
jgi:hypothetical protein